MNHQVQTTGGHAAPNPTNSAASTGNSPVPHVVPPVDVFEDEAGITLLADLPGVNRERLSVRVDGDSLLIEGTVDVAGPREMDIVYGEAQVPAYRREFTLSRELDASGIEAQLKDGVLRLSIPKAEQARPRRIEVKLA